MAGVKTAADTKRIKFDSFDSAKGESKKLQQIAGYVADSSDKTEQNDLISKFQAVDPEDKSAKFQKQLLLKQQSTKTAPQNAALKFKVTDSSKAKIIILPPEFVQALDSDAASFAEGQLTKSFHFGSPFDYQTYAFQGNIVKSELGKRNISADAHLFNASQISLFKGINVIAMGYPFMHSNEARLYFWDMMKEHGVNYIFDLRGNEATENFRYYNKIDCELKGQKLKLEIKCEEQSENYTLSVCIDDEPFDVTRRCYQKWGDNQGLDTNDFVALVNDFSSRISQGKVMVHCIEGQGRTMTLIAGLEIKQLIASNKITRDNYKLEVAKTINRLAKQRGNCVIKAPAQQALLLDAAKFWLDKQGESQS